MEMGSTPRHRRGALQRMRLVGGLGLAALILACATAVPASAKKMTSVVWLCKGGKGGATNPCNSSLTNTVVQTNGSTSVSKDKKAHKPQVDCFYVYPTVSEQTTENANLTIEPQQTQIAIDQASRFSQACRVFAPMYKQLTLKAINEPPVPESAAAIAYLSMREAFEEYMSKYNEGRGIVLIGHSQGSALLKVLMQEQFDNNAAMREKLVGAVLLGGNVLVPEGELVGGDFQHIPLCQSAIETHCLIAYSTFLKEPPEGAFFGRANSPLLGGGSHEGMQVACVNPTQLTQDEGSAGPLLPYASTTPFPGILGTFTPTPKAATPWVSSPGEYTAQCHNENKASWLQVNPVGTAVNPPEYVMESLGPDWGLHLYDVNIALGNLVKTVALQIQAYGFEA
jgi:Protein of unknown function (DUF3089)